MKAPWVVVLICATAVAVQACKAKKREPVPGPQVGSAVVVPREGSLGTNPHRAPSARTTVRSARSTEVGHTHGAGGIAWFQGTVEEAFSVTVGHSAEGRSSCAPPKGESP